MNEHSSSLDILKNYLRASADISSEEELYALEGEYKDKLSGMADETELFELISDLTHRLAALKSDTHGLPICEKELSEEEREENRLVQMLLDDNLFTYHFQPIVRAENGEVYAYEALMRADGMEGITPYHILKYAELSGRLGDVEQYTFMNILRLVNSDRDMFHGKPVFINSMPNIRIRPDASSEIEKMFAERLGNVVVEMVERSEYNESELNHIKEKYQTLGIPIAIDDYGTGYSNISNLLRYTPNYVKIDRALLSGIEHSPNKKHFVREIIDFCHANNILALAEGVETTEELRTAILLGADLIQGFYTARPSAEVIAEIPYELKSEIKAHRQELEDGRRLKIYSAEKNERILLDRLSGEGYSCIKVGLGCSGGEVILSGSPHQDSGIHIIIADGFNGKLTLKNVKLSNIVGRPCIEMGNDCELTLSLVGSNMLCNGGICVPESSVFKTEGDGSLDIKLAYCDWYGIGNDLKSRHGRLHFEQNGTISVTAESHAGVCIGSGLGGEIEIGRGRYYFSLAGSSNIGIGAFRGSTSISMVGCDFECVSTGAFSVGIGSTEGDMSVHIMFSSVKVTLDSQLAVGIGTLHGNKASIHTESMSVVMDMNADMLTAFGALIGNSDIMIERTSVTLTENGSEALAFGGRGGQTLISFTDVDLKGKILNTANVTTYAEPENQFIKGGSYQLALNGKVLEVI